MNITSTHITSILIDPNARSDKHTIRAPQITRRGALDDASAEGIPVEEFGWTRSDALRLRAQLSSWAELWDDDDLDVYNEFLKR